MSGEFTQCQNFTFRETHRSARREKGLGRRIHMSVAKQKVSIRAASTSSEGCGDASKEDLLGSCFCDEVIPADTEAFEFVFLARISREEKDRNLGIGLANLTTGSRTAHARHHDIENDEVRRMAKMRFDGFAPVLDGKDRMSGTNKDIRHHRKKMSVVIGNQNSGGRIHC